jgi:hypothetical protein
MATSDKGGRKIGPEHVLRNPAVLYLKRYLLKQQLACKPCT